MSAAPVRHLGVYDADGGLAGELRYIVGHVLGVAACSLCDMTHSHVRRRPAWDRMVASLGIPFDLRHRNELTATEQARVVGMGLPLVAAELADGTFVRILDDAGVAACQRDPDRLRVALNTALPRQR